MTRFSYHTLQGVTRALPSGLQDALDLEWALAGGSMDKNRRDFLQTLYGSVAGRALREPVYPAIRRGSKIRAGFLFGA